MSTLETRITYAAGLTLGLVGALSCHGDRSYSAGPSALIRDANHDAGSPFFFWLSPLLQQDAPPNQVFSAHVSPTVTVTNLCTGDVIRTFAGAQVEAPGDYYKTNWRTREDSLDTACHYRIAVTAGSRQLGVADVDVVENGRELRMVDTDNYIPLLDDRTLPIRFFIGVGAQCKRVDTDCGEGVAQPGAATTIVTTHGRAGVFVPAGAVDQPVMVIIESSDQRPCIAGLQAPVFVGQIGPFGNSCYDFHTDPPLTEANASGKFNTNVTVGICAETGALDHATRDLLQIFQFHAGAVPEIFGLNNTPAPFLVCDQQLGHMGSQPSLLDQLAARLGSVVTLVAAPIVPRPLYARTTAVLDVGAGGETDMFSRFTWALPSALDFDFDRGLESGAILPGALVNSAYTRLGVTLSRTSGIGLCPGSGVYARPFGSSNSISVCPLGLPVDFNELGSGAIKASFVVPAAEVCITATPTGFHVPLLPGGVAFIEAFDATGNVLDRTESSTQRVPQRLCVQGAGIKAVRFAGKGSAFAIFDNLHWAR